MHGEDLRLARIDPDLGQDRHQGSTERLELLLGFPDLTDFEVAVLTEAAVVLTSVGS